MKTLRMQRRLAGKILGIGEGRVWIDPERINDTKEAITNLDIKELIKEGVIKKKPKKGVKRRSGKIRQERKKKGRGRGPGKKKSKTKNKKDYIHKIRKLRKHISELKKSEKITPDKAKKLKRLSKSGEIRTKEHIKSRI